MDGCHHQPERGRSDRPISIGENPAACTRRFCARMPCIVTRLACRRSADSCRARAGDTGASLVQQRRGRAQHIHNRLQVRAPASQPARATRPAPPAALPACACQADMPCCAWQGTLSVTLDTIALDTIALDTIVRNTITCDGIAQAERHLARRHCAQRLRTRPHYPRRHLRRREQPSCLAAVASRPGSASSRSTAPRPMAPRSPAPRTPASHNRQQQYVQLHACLSVCVRVSVCPCVHVSVCPCARVRPVRLCSVSRVICWS